AVDEQYALAEPGCADIREIVADILGGRAALRRDELADHAVAGIERFGQRVVQLYQLAWCKSVRAAVQLGRRRPPGTHRQISAAGRGLSQNGLCHRSRLRPWALPTGSGKDSHASLPNVARTGRRRI